MHVPVSNRRRCRNYEIEGVSVDGPLVVDLVIEEELRSPAILANINPSICERVEQDQHDEECLECEEGVSYCNRHCDVCRFDFLDEIF